MPRIALSPSTQTWNVGHYSGTNEQDVNYEIASLLAPILRAAGVECDIMTAGRGNPGSGYVANADQSNRQGPYLAHVCLHTDAGGATGTTAFHYPGSVSGENLARAIYDQLAPLSPGADHGVRARADLYELSATTAISVLVETAPHDRAADAAWIQNSIPEIAQAYARGILGWLAAGGYITYTQEGDMGPIKYIDQDGVERVTSAEQALGWLLGNDNTTDRRLRKLESAIYGGGIPVMDATGTPLPGVGTDLATEAAWNRENVRRAAQAAGLTDEQITRLVEQIGRQRIEVKVV